MSAVLEPDPATLREACAFLAGSDAVVLGAFAPDGAMLHANRGMLTLLAGHPPARALERLVSPSLAELRGRGFAYRGRLHFGDLKDAVHTVRGDVRPLDAGLFIVAEFDVVELERVTSEVSALNSEMANLQRRLSSEQIALRRALDELRATQASLIHAEKMSALGSFAAGLAHELNNPLGFVTSNVRTLAASQERLLEGYRALEAAIPDGQGAARAVLARLRAELELDFLAEDSSDLVKGTLDGLVRMKKIIESLRGFLRPGEPRVEAADVAPCLESTLAIAGPLLRQGDVQVTVELDALPRVRCDPVELGQVLLNLVANATHAVACRARGEGRIAVRGRRERDRVVIEVEDNGVGMPDRVLRRIFEPFYTTKPIGEGTGLGLHLAYHVIVDRSGGTITATSTPGLGSTFKVTLPEEAPGGP
jgi:signal transduction histidine kinase